MYPDLTEAPENRPLFIRHIASPSPARRCSRVGLEEGAQIEIKNRAISILPQWVQTRNARVILSGSFSASLLVAFENNTARSLALLENGQKGQVNKAFCSSQDFRALEKLGLTSRALVRKLKTLKPYDFIVETDHGKNLRLTLEEAVRISISLDAESKQLADIRPGQRFIIESVINDSHPETNCFKDLITGRRMQLKKLVLPQHDEPLHAGVYIHAKKRLQLCLPRHEAKKIRVGICEICWSCGECENL